MVHSLSNEQIISKDVLCELAELRLREAEALLKAGFPAGTVYLAGYAVECYLKAAVCTSLHWDYLLGSFRVHDLDSLLRYSGFDRELRSNAEVFENFAKISGIWTMTGNDSVRYRRPNVFGIGSAGRFLEYISDPKIGVATWLQRRVS